VAAERGMLSCTTAHHKCHVEHAGSLRRQDAVHTEEDAARGMNAALTQGQMQAHTGL
jgi:hypothetical protein